MVSPPPYGCARLSPQLTPRRVRRDADNHPERRGGEGGKLLHAAEDADAPVEEREGEEELRGRQRRHPRAAKVEAHVAADKGAGEEQQPEVVREGGHQLAEEE